MRSTHTMKVMLALALSVALAGVSTAGCQRKVEVKSGTRTVCTAGEVISDDVKTIMVPANKASAYRVRTITVTCDKHANVPPLYAEAQAALAAGDTKLAAAKLAQVLALDPAYRKAKEQAALIAKGGKPAPDAAPAPSTGTTTTAPVVPSKPGEQPTATVGALGKWTPDTITGFVAAKPLSDALTVSREYIPSGDSPAQGLVIVAEQFRTADDAKGALAHQVKQAYPKDSATLKINGHDAYFGTDGRRFATIGFTNGAVMIALELTAPKSPEDLRALAEKVAKQLP
jgi:hypothetical protein